MFLMETPVWVILSPFALICVTAYFCAWRYHDTNDVKKSIKLYVPISLSCVVLFWLVAGLPPILGVFMVLSGFVMLMFFSNRFFYSDS